MSNFVFLAVCIFFSFCSAWNCPLYGPIFPQLQHPGNSSIIQETIANLTALFEAIDADNSTGTGNNSYAVKIFSINDQYPTLFEHYHTSPNLANQSSPGVKNVDGDTIWRLGSVTKIFTIFTWLAEAGDSYFVDPITKHVPELAALVANKSGDAISRVAWEDITIGELASQMSGISNDSMLPQLFTVHQLTLVDTLLGELTITAGFNASGNGFPVEPAPPCGIYPLPLCDRARKKTSC
jgi:CubicO group peptidase (beta-lactamase class C family)